MHTVQRLLHSFTPEHYHLTLTIDRVGRTFQGTVRIKGTSSSDQITLHAKDLTVLSATIDSAPATWKMGVDDELTLVQPSLSGGTHAVEITYSGQITDQLHGLYPCSYTIAGEKKELLATQFESHYARNVFPCVDEPEAKATFDLELITETDVTVLGNMPIKTQLTRDHSLVTSFETTPKMSTYLLAFVIGELQHKSAKTKDGVDVTIYATPAQSEKSLDFALQHSIDTIEFFNDYFGVPYPLPKSDQVALPDFANGAMENWGLITYRESALLYDPSTTSFSSKKYIATVISHELSHQWFGNLVTMRWWDDLWLNESFATIMEYVCVDALYPDWNVWLDFNLNEAVYAMRRDSLEGVQSVKIDVNHPDEIQSVFDGAIVYAKGACLLRMLREMVGETAFKQGLAGYFQKHAYSNTTGEDLWEALRAASGKDVGHFMDAWLSQSGFPVVRAQRRGQDIELTQKQFLLGPHVKSTKRWPIPIDDRFFSDTSILITPDRTPFALNVNDINYHVTNYDNDLRRQLLGSVRDGHTDVVRRAQLLKEQSLLAKSTELSSSQLVDLIQVYTNETNEKVWGMLSGVISDLKRFVDPHSPAEQALKKIARSIASPLYATLGWDEKPNESDDDTLLRSTIIGTMLYGEDADTIAEARHRYATQNIDDMNSELRELILIAEIRHGNTNSTINDLLHIYKTTPSVDIKNSICDAITAVEVESEIVHLLSLLNDTTLIRTQDTAMWYVRLLSNRHARSLTWEWMRENWKWIETTFGGDKSYDSFPRYSAQVLATRQQLNEFVAFFTPKLNDTAISRAITVGINDITARVELIEADKDAVERRLVE